MAEPYVELRTMYRYHVVVSDSRTDRVHGRWNVLATQRRDAEDAVKDACTKKAGFPDTITFTATKTSATPMEVAVVCH